LKIKHQSPIFDVEDYYNSNSSVPSIRKVIFAQSKTESSPTIIVHAMMIGVVNFEEEFACVKAALERLSKESAEKDAHIKP